VYEWVSDNGAQKTLWTKAAACLPSNGAKTGRVGAGRVQRAGGAVDHGLAGDVPSVEGAVAGDGTFNDRCFTYDGVALFAWK
jgi:hypothetical protein